MNTLDVIRPVLYSNNCILVIVTALIILVAILRHCQQCGYLKRWKVKRKRTFRNAKRWLYLLLIELGVNIPILVGLVLTTFAAPNDSRTLAWYLCGIACLIVAIFMIYKVIIEFKKPNRAAIRRTRRKSLGNFLLQGQQILRQIPHDELPNAKNKLEQWNSDVEAYLLSKFDSSYVARFRSMSLRPQKIYNINSAEHRRLVMKHDAKLACLEIFITENVS